jgi:hypothetical protein
MTLRTEIVRLACSAAVIAACVLPFVEMPTGKSPAMVPLRGYSEAVAPRLIGWHDPRLRRLPDEPDLAFATRLNGVVSDAIYHCDYAAAPRLVDRLVVALFGANEGLITPRALVCGFCHQSAYVLARALSNAGLKALVLGLNGHVVTAIDVNGQRLIFDPDFGVGPFRYAELSMERTMRSYTSAFMGNLPSLTSLRDALRVTVDDAEYRPMRELDLIELKQSGLLMLVDWLAAILACIAAWHGAGAVRRLWARLPGWRAAGAHASPVP